MISFLILRKTFFKITKHNRLSEFQYTCHQLDIYHQLCICYHHHKQHQHQHDLTQSKLKSIITKKKKKKYCRKQDRKHSSRHISTLLDTVAPQLCTQTLPERIFAHTRLKHRRTCHQHHFRLRNEHNNINNNFSLIYE